jgi:tetratricopeptide (TPR) repeat protein
MRQKIITAAVALKARPAAICSYMKNNIIHPNKAKSTAGLPPMERVVLTQDSSALLELAWVRYDQGKLEESLACFEELFERELGGPVFTGFAFDELVRIYRQNGDWRRLVSTCEKACRAFAEETHLIQTLGEAYLAAGDYKSATQTCQRLLALDAENTSYYFLLIEARLALGNLDDVSELFQKVAALESDNLLYSLFLFSQKLLKRGYYERAEEALQECATLSGHDPLYCCSWGDCLLKQKKLAAALALYDAVLTAAPETSAAGYCNRFAISLLNEGFGEHAIAYLEKATALADDKKCQS